MMNKRIQKKLTQLAIASSGIDDGRVRMAAGIVYRKRLIATGVNSYKTHPIMLGDGYREGQHFLHAEADAIRNALRLMSVEELSKCDIYIVRVKRPHIGAKTWIHGLAKPCPGCATTIQNYGLRQVYYTTDV